MQEVLKAEINYKINPSVQQRCPLLSDVDVRGEQEDSRMGRSPPLPSKQRQFTFICFSYWDCLRFQWEKRFYYCLTLGIYVTV